MASRQAYEDILPIPFRMKNRTVQFPFTIHFLICLCQTCRLSLANEMYSYYKLTHVSEMSSNMLMRTSPVYIIN